MSKNLHTVLMQSAIVFMPDYPSPRPSSHNFTRNVTIGFVDHSGHTANSRISGIDPTVTGAEVDAMRAALGKISNAGVYRDALEDDTRMAIVDAISHIDPFAEVSDKGVLRFDHPNNQVEEIYVEIPAIYDQFVNEGGSLKTEHADIADAVNKVLAVLNKAFQPEDDKYFLGKAYFSDRKGGKSGVKSPRPVSRDPRGGGGGGGV